MTPAGWVAGAEAAELFDWLAGWQAGRSLLESAALEVECVTVSNSNDTSNSSELDSPMRYSREGVWAIASSIQLPQD